ncbi:SGNH/GDSL hydrolase family protein [Clostridium sp. MT-14]|uniref:SGNH/GDSL hydrolase family protein n=1 Tax=Clostridium aromativorans TaxID=2836848 RepID=A0ABS8NA34_9CLOT|nr:SGNH/GDSL hydrolase family protein [Clostridium aromativorans]MCC9296678.1 SGNH/GDSL hydrolase family protein [Clostridium aromativorans]
MKTDKYTVSKICCGEKVSFQDTWTSWENNEKFPVAFLGDSTVDGNETTSWVKNEIGQDHQPPHAFTTYLQNLVRVYTGSNTARIYNAGFSGQTASWAYSNINSIFAGNYSDVKMIGIGFGINDRLGVTSTKDYESDFKRSIENIILWCFKNNIQPFLLTTQATVEPGSTDSSSYPYRTSESINSVANTVKKNLAKKYNIQLMDLNYYTSKLLSNNDTYSLKNIISQDHLHFKDKGHEFEAETIFAYFNPRVVVLDGKNKLKIDFTSQNIKSNVESDKVSFENSPINLWYGNNLFNNFIYYCKKDDMDTLLQDFLVFNLSNGLELYSMQIQVPKNPGYTLPSSEDEKPYVIFNDKKYVLKDTFIDSYFSTMNVNRPFLVDNLRFGLNKVKLYSGKFNRAASGGFYISRNFKNYSSRISIVQDTNGDISKQFLTPYKFQNYFEHKALFKLNIDSNISTSRTKFLVPVVDRADSGLALEFENGTVELIEYVRKSSCLDDVGNLKKLAYINTQSNSQESTKSIKIYVRINEASIEVYKELKSSPIITYNTHKEIIGSGIFANFIKLEYQCNGDYLILDTDILYSI